MSNTTVECANCGDPTQQVSLNEDGHCPDCACCRISSPPPEKKAPNVSRFQRTGHHGETTKRLMREPLKSKIPIAELIESGKLRLPSAPRVPGTGTP